MLWMAGVKAEAIAVEIGVSYPCLVRNRRQLGLPHRYRNPGVVGAAPALSHSQADAARVLWKEGRDTKTIAWKLKQPESAVYNSIRAGIVRG